MNARYDFIVIGAGLAGLSCAFRLKEKGWKVLVLEKSSLPGGRLQTNSVHGCLSDSGAQFLSAGYPVINKLIVDLNLKKELSEIPSTMSFYTSAGKLSLNTKNPLSLLLSGLLPVSSFLKLSFDLGKKSSTLMGLNFENASALEMFDEQTSEDYLANRLDMKAITRLFGPFFSAFNYASSAELSEAMVYRTYGHFIQRKSLVCLKEGMNTLINSLASRVTLQTEAEVESLKRTDDGWEVVCKDATYHSSKIILATTAQAAKVLLKNEPFYAPDVLEVEYAPSVHQAFVFRRKAQARHHYGNVIMEDKNPDFNVMTFESKKCERLCPDELELIHILSSKDGFRKEMSGEDSFAPAMKLIEELTPYRASELITTKKTIWPEAIPVFSPGRARKIAGYRKSIRRDDQLFLVGDYMGTPCSEGAAESAHFISTLF